MSTAHFRVSFEADAAAELAGENFFVSPWSRKSAAAPRRPPRGARRSPDRAASDGAPARHPVSRWASSRRSAQRRSPRHERLDVRLARAEEVDVDPLRPERLLEQAPLLVETAPLVHRQPLERRPGLRYERVHGKRNAAHPPALAGEAEHHLLADPHGDARHPEDVVFGLGGQAAHEIHLRAASPASACSAAFTIWSSVKSLLMTCRIRSVPASGAIVIERSPPAMSAGQLGSDRVHAQGRRAERAAELADVAGERVEPRVVGGVRAGEPEPEAALDALLRLGAQRLEIHLPVQSWTNPAARSGSPRGSRARPR